MNAGKSTALLQAAFNYRERGMKTLIFTAALDARAGPGIVASRIGLTEPARMFGAATDLYTEIQAAIRADAVACVFVDEAQFLTKPQVWQLARIADRLSIPVLCYGLRTDFRGELFPGSAELLAIADNLREIRTICHCGRKATMVVRRTPDGRAITSGDQVGIEKSMYVSLCRSHWDEETGRWPAASLLKTKPATPARKKATAKKSKPSRRLAVRPRRAVR